LLVLCADVLEDEFVNYVCLSHVFSLLHINLMLMILLSQSILTCFHHSLSQSQRVKGKLPLQNFVCNGGIERKLEKFLNDACHYQSQKKSINVKFFLVLFLQINVFVPPCTCSLLEKSYITYFVRSELRLLKPYCQLP
jgi:hypothetical protein